MNYQFNCKLIYTDFQGYKHRIQIYNPKYELCFTCKQMCDECKTKEVRPSICQEYVLMNQNDISMMCKIQIYDDIELSESQFYLKFSCLKCNIFIKYVELKKHQLKSINYRNQGDGKQIRQLRQKIESLYQTKCYIQSNNFTFNKITMKLLNCSEVFKKIRDH